MFSCYIGLSNNKCSIKLKFNAFDIKRIEKYK